MSTPHYVYGCDRLLSEIEEDNILCIIETDNIPKVYIQSDGGHGGLVEISHCPFCGSKITFYTERVE